MRFLCPLASAIQDEELVFDCQGLGKKASRATGAHELGDAGDQMDKKNQSNPHVQPAWSMVWILSVFRIYRESGILMNSPGTSLRD